LYRSRPTDPRECPADRSCPSGSAEPGLKRIARAQPSAWVVWSGGARPAGCATIPIWIRPAVSRMRTTRGSGRGSASLVVWQPAFSGSEWIVFTRNGGPSRVLCAQQLRTRTGPRTRTEVPGGRGSGGARHSQFWLLKLTFHGFTNCRAERDVVRRRRSVIQVVTRIPPRKAGPSPELLLAPSPPPGATCVTKGAGFLRCDAGFSGIRLRPSDWSATSLLIGPLFASANND
jgi:hypothetical protein